MLPCSSSTPPATTPTSAAAATAAVYISELSTTQQLVASAVAQQQCLQQQAAAAQLSVPQTANAAMAEAVAAVAEFSGSMGAPTVGTASQQHQQLLQQQQDRSRSRSRQQSPSPTVGMPTMSTTPTAVSPTTMPATNSATAAAAAAQQQQQHQQQQMSFGGEDFYNTNTNNSTMTPSTTSPFGASMSLPLQQPHYGSGSPSPPSLVRYNSGPIQLTPVGSLPPASQPTPQLRPASTAPFSHTLTSAVVASALASNSSHPATSQPMMSYEQQQGLVGGGAAAGKGLPQENTPGAGQQPMMMPTLRAVTDANGTPQSTTTTSPGDHQTGGVSPAGQGNTLRDHQDSGVPVMQPRKTSHKRERSMHSATPALADPSTAPVVKCSKGDAGGMGTQHITMGTSPDSCILGAAVVARSGDASPLQNTGGFGSASGSLPLPEAPSGGTSSLGTTPPTGVTPLLGSTPTGNEATNDGFDLDGDVAALMQAALAPKPGKRRGRPPGRAHNAVPAAPGEPREPTDAEILECLLREDPARRQLPVDEIKKLVRREKNRISAAISRSRVQQYTAALESRVRTLQAEQAELYGWLQAPPQALPHRVLLVGPAAAAATAAAGVSSPTKNRPPIRHLSL